VVVLLELSAGREDNETADSRRTINLEISPVEGKDPAQSFSFGNPHERRIR
jgi:hypothetical protein